VLEVFGEGEKNTTSVSNTMRPKPNTCDMKGNKEKIYWQAESQPSLCFWKYLLVTIYGFPSSV
jgi:hypothetical protein